MKKIIYICCVLIFLLVIVNLVGGIYDLWHKKDLLTAAQSKLTQEQKENNDLKKELAVVKTTQFVEEQARDKLLLVRKGESPVVISSDVFKRNNSANNQNITLPIWQQWWNLFF